MIKIIYYYYKLIMYRIFKSDRGRITVVKELDYETTKIYHLICFAHGHSIVSIR